MTREVIRNGEGGVMTDQVRRRSSGHGAQGLDNGHIIRACGPNEQTVVKRQNGSKMGPSGVDEEGGMDITQRDSRDTWI